MYNFEGQGHFHCIIWKMRKILVADHIRQIHAQKNILLEVKDVKLI